MNDLISGVMSIRLFLEKKNNKIGYVDCGSLEQWELYSNRKYVIPGYQREIKWKPENVQILLEDISRGSKFLGNVLLSTSDRVEYSLIDGQQRITAIIMALERINMLKEGGLSIDICEFANESYPLFLDVVKSDFCLNEEKQREYVETDYLSQDDVVRKLWKCICDNLKNCTEDELCELENKILDSRISVLISKVDETRNDSRRMCVDYFIDINNKSENLGPTDILKAYAFRESFNDSSAKWIEIQKNIRTLSGIYYPKEALFFHYFLCTVSSKLNYKVTGLTEEFKTKKDISINGVTYLKGTDIEILLSPYQTFYRDMLKRLLEFQKFMAIVQRDKTSPSVEFCKYLEVNGIDDDTKVNTFVIINSILKNSDVVPKLLVMKYYLEVLSKTEKTKDDIKLIYWINVLATFFSASKTTRKSTDTFASIVLKEKWREKIVEKAHKNLDDFPKIIGFRKEIYQDGKSTPVSGQYLARRLHVIAGAYKKGEKWSYNEHKLRILSNTTGEINDEHFLVNRSGKVSFSFGASKKLSFIELPKAANSRVSFLSNYLLINSSINSRIENKSIIEKIHIIDKALESRENVFANRMSGEMFSVIRDIFISSACPKQEDLDRVNDEAEAKQMLQEYYENEFLLEYDEYVTALVSSGISIG